MTQHSPTTSPELPQLIKATFSAVLIAAVLLICVVLPAEYGIDPTGAGKAIGLFRLSSTAAESSAPPPPTTLAAPGTQELVSKTTLSLRSDEMTLHLAPGEEGEIKALMQKGSHIVFSWSTNAGEVRSDMHGEPTDAKPNEFSTYWKEKRQANGHGAFVAPFDGTHGWYWQNRGEKPVTITVKVVGFHEKLFHPT